MNQSEQTILRAVVQQQLRRRGFPIGTRSTPVASPPYKQAGHTTAPNEIVDRTEWHKADIPFTMIDVRFRGQSGH